MTYNRHFFAGAAIQINLTSGCQPTDTTLQVTAPSGWPASYPYYATIDKGAANEEKVEVTNATASTLTVNRGKDGTAPTEHTTGATVQHTIDAGTLSAHETFVAGNGTVTPSTSHIGDAGTAGTSTLPAAADHQHPREGFASGVVTSSAVGDAAADGTSASPARADHKHARESAASILSTVQSQFTAAGQLIVGTGSGAGELLTKGSAGTMLTVGGADPSGLEWFNAPSGAVVDTTETTSSTSFTDLTTSGPAVTLNTGTKAIVTLTATMSNNTQNDYATMSFAISGATTQAASSSLALSSPALTDPAGTTVSNGTTLFVSGLTPGSNTFTAKYAAGLGGTATFNHRHITVIPLP